MIPMITAHTGLKIPTQIKKSASPRPKADRPFQATPVVIAPLQPGVTVM